MNVCRDNRCDGSRPVDEGLHIKDKKKTWTLLLAFVSCHKLRLTLFFFIRLKTQQCMHLPLLYHRCVGKHICKISIYDSFWESNLFYTIFLKLLRRSEGEDGVFYTFCIVTLFSFVPIHFELRENGPFLKRAICEIALFRGNFDCFFPKSCNIDFYFTLRNSF